LKTINLIKKWMSEKLNNIDLYDGVLTIFGGVLIIFVILFILIIKLYSLNNKINEYQVETVNRIDDMNYAQSTLIYSNSDLEVEIINIKSEFESLINNINTIETDLKSINITLSQVRTENLNQSRINYTQSEFETLCMLVQHEAGGESQLCRLMVASIIINRVNDIRYPNNLNDVIFDTNGGLQFSPSLNLYKTPSDDTIAAVAEALRYDLSGGAWIFNNKDYTSDSMQSWFNKYELVIEVDGVQFRK